jgi:hypothetical protein
MDFLDRPGASRHWDGKGIESAFNGPVFFEKL